MQTALAAGSVELADLIAGFGVVPQHLVSVRKAFRHIKRAAIVFVQFDGDVLAERSGFRDADPR